jgi:hypothetical protein
MGIQKPQIEEGQATQWTREKEQTTITKNYRLV